MLKFFKTYPELDYSDLKEIKELQWQKIKQVINRVYRYSPFYKNLFKRHNIKPPRIKSWEDFAEIPLTTKEDLRKHNFDFIGEKKEKWADVFTTGGTTGKPIYFPITAKDLSRTAYAELRCLSIAGVKKGDLVQFNMPMSTAMWGAGMSYYLGYQLIGAGVLRTGTGFPEQQLQTLETLGATVIHSNVGFLIKLGKMAKERKIMDRLKVKLILAGLENIIDDNLRRNEMGKILEEIWKKARVCAVYGNTESASPINECKYKTGYHLTSEFCYVEIVNPETKEVLPVGEKGMMVITPLDVEGLPLLRFALGDISFLVEGKCRCGRKALRLGPILGRYDEMIKIKGVIVYPQTFEEILLRYPQVAQYYIEVDKDENYLDRVRIYFAPTTKSPATVKKLIQDIKYAIKSHLQITVEIIAKPQDVIQKRIIPKGSTKPRKFFDLRPK